jgi:hypothetical protein
MITKPRYLSHPHPSQHSCCRTCIGMNLAAEHEALYAIGMVSLLSDMQWRCKHRLACLVA